MLVERGYKKLALWFFLNFRKVISLSAIETKVCLVSCSCFLAAFRVLVVVAKPQRANGDSHVRSPKRYFGMILLESNVTLLLDKNKPTTTHAYQVLDQFLQHPIETREELLEAFLIGTRLLKFLQVILPTHPEYAQLPARQLEHVEETVHDLTRYTDEIALMIDQDEHEAYITRVLAQSGDNVKEEEGGEDVKKNTKSSTFEDDHDTRMESTVDDETFAAQDEGREELLLFYSSSSASTGIGEVEHILSRSASRGSDSSVSSVKQYDNKSNKQHNREMPHHNYKQHHTDLDSLEVRGEEDTPPGRRRLKMNRAGAVKQQQSYPIQPQVRSHQQQQSQQLQAKPQPSQNKKLPEELEMTISTSPDQSTESSTSGSSSSESREHGNFAYAMNVDSQNGPHRVVEEEGEALSQLWNVSDWSDGTNTQSIPFSSFITTSDSDWNALNLSLERGQGQQQTAGAAFPHMTGGDGAAVSDDDSHMNQNKHDGDTIGWNFFTLSSSQPAPTTRRSQPQQEQTQHSTSPSQQRQLSEEIEPLLLLEATTRAPAPTMTPSKPKNSIRASDTTGRPAVTAPLRAPRTSPSSRSLESMRHMECRIEQSQMPRNLYGNSVRYDDEKDEEDDGSDNAVVPMSLHLRFHASFDEQHQQQPVSPTEEQSPFAFADDLSLSTFNSPLSSQDSAKAERHFFAEHDEKGADGKEPSTSLVGHSQKRYKTRRKKTNQNAATETQVVDWETGSFTSSTACSSTETGNNYSSTGSNSKKLPTSSPRRNCAPQRNHHVSSLTHRSFRKKSDAILLRLVDTEEQDLLETSFHHNLRSNGAGSRAHDHLYSNKGDPDEPNQLSFRRRRRTLHHFRQCVRFLLDD